MKTVCPVPTSNKDLIYVKKCHCSKVYGVFKKNLNFVPVKANNTAAVVRCLEGYLINLETVVIVELAGAAEFKRLEKLWAQLKKVGSLSPQRESEAMKAMEVSYQATIEQKDKDIVTVHDRLAKQMKLNKNLFDMLKAKKQKKELTAVETAL